MTTPKSLTGPNSVQKIERNPPVSRVMQDRLIEPEGVRRLPVCTMVPETKRGSVPPEKPLFGIKAEEPDELERNLGALIEEGLGRPLAKKENPGKEKRGSVPPEKPLFESADPRDRMVEAVEEMLALDLDLSQTVPTGVDSLGDLVSQRPSSGSSK